MVSHHEVHPRNETIFPQDFLREIRRTVISLIRGRPENKVHLVLVCEMERMNPVTGEVEETVMMSPFRTLQEPVYNSTDLETIYERMMAKMLESFSEYLRNGSEWMFKRVIRLDITFSRIQTRQRFVVHSVTGRFEEDQVAHQRSEQKGPPLF